MTDWRTEVLGENIAAENPEMFQYMERFKTPADAVKSAHEVHKLNTRKTDDIKKEVEKQFTPADDWKDDQWKAFTDRIRVKDATAYKAEVPENLKPFIKQDKIDAMVKIMHEDGVHPRQANRLMKEYLKAESAAIQTLTAETERIKAEDKAALEKEWGAEMSKNDELSRRGMTFGAKAAGMDEKAFGELLKTYGMDTHPAFKKMFKFIGEVSGDPKFVAGGQKSDNKTEKSTGQIMVEEAKNPTL